ncbi:hypothetical protein JCM10450v2_005345 [Rhodotorula kratochvilovae]
MPAASSSIRRYRPFAQLPKAAAACAEAGAAYGKCIGARYQDVERDVCAREFAAFRQCVLEQLLRSLRVPAVAPLPDPMLMPPPAPVQMKARK